MSLKEKQEALQLQLYRDCMDRLSLSNYALEYMVRQYIRLDAHYRQITITEPQEDQLVNQYTFTAVEYAAKRYEREIENDRSTTTLP